MRRTFRVLVLVLLAAVSGAAGPAQAQDFDEPAFAFDGQYLSAAIQGLKRLTWLPRGLGYLEHEREATGNHFYRVDPASGNRTPLFDSGTATAIISAFNDLSGNTATSLPFDEFTSGHVMQGRRNLHVTTKTLAYFLEHLKPDGWAQSIDTIWSELEQRNTKP